ncbi:MAG TPA: hypothetical protein DDW93_05500 [Firmicutes bacterium]|nr:hypothetical protein [Bacillota bacterium]
MALLELRIFNLIEEPDDLPEETETPLTDTSSSFSITIKDIFSETRFLQYTLVSLFFYFAWQTPWPLFSWYQVKVLGANNVWVSILSLMNTGGSLVGYQFWVNFIEKHGNLKTLFFSTISIFIVPAVYAFSHDLYTIAAFNLLTGGIFSGVNLALFNTLLEVTPEMNKTSYIAYYNTAITCATVISPVVGVSLLKIMNFQWAFIVCAILRILGGFGFLALSLVEERENKSPLWNGLG